MWLLVWNLVLIVVICSSVRGVANLCVLEESGLGCSDACTCGRDTGTTDSYVLWVGSLLMIGCAFATVLEWLWVEFSNSGKVVVYVFEEPVQFAVALELQLVKTEVYRFAIK